MAQSHETHGHVHLATSIDILATRRRSSVASYLVRIPWAYKFCEYPKVSLFFAVESLPIGGIHLLLKIPAKHPVPCKCGLNA